MAPMTRRGSVKSNCGAPGAQVRGGVGCVFDQHASPRQDAVTLEPANYDDGVYPSISGNGVDPLGANPRWRLGQRLIEDPARCEFIRSIFVAQSAVVFVDERLSVRGDISANDVRNFVQEGEEHFVETLASARQGDDWTSLVLVRCAGDFAGRKCFHEHEPNADRTEPFGQILEAAWLTNNAAHLLSERLKPLP